MNNPILRRSASLTLALALAFSPLPAAVGAAEEDGLCKHHPAHTTDCGYAESGVCGHTCSMDNGCITITCTHTHVATCFDMDGSSLCRHACTDTPACYAPVTNCLHKEHGNCGHAEGEDCDFAVNGCPDCEAEAAITEIKGTDVTIDGYIFHYTGQEIRPTITVQVGDTLLTEGTHYTLTYENNIGVGTGSVTVTGISEAGYRGIVTIPFTIEKAPGTPEFTLVEIKGTDVTVDGTEFTFTGQAIEPAVTVTVNGQVLTAGKDYSLTYANNVQPGTGSVTIKGIATASETLGYTGEVTIEFTIIEKQPEATEPEATEPEATEPEATEPEATEPEATEPEATEPEESEPQPIAYKITKGDAATWYQGSGKQLSFTVNGASRDFTGVSINGKKLNTQYYSTKDNTVVTLNTSFLNRLTVGKYTITVHFEDGKADGTVTVSDKLDTTNPVTGDGINLAALAAVMLGSLTALGTAWVYRKRFIK